MRELDTTTLLYFVRSRSSLQTLLTFLNSHEITPSLKISVLPKLSLTSIKQTPYIMDSQGIFPLLQRYTYRV